MRFTLSLVLVLSAVGCGGSGKGSDGGAGGGSGSGGTDMSAGTGGTGGDGGMHFGDGGLHMHDMASQCDVTAQTGCPSGDKCVPYGFGGAGYCVPNGTVAEGGACTSTTSGGIAMDNCLAGYVCDDTTGTGICRKMCGADSDCTTSGQLCGSVSYNYNACLPTCTPFGSDCASGTDCGTAVYDASATQSSLTGFFVCKMTGSGALYSSCKSDSACGAGLECDNGPAGHICLPNCDSTHACPATPMVDGGSGTISCQVFTNLSNMTGYCDTGM